ncbi:MAG: hypothetical protein NXH75_15795 [Halobacteriovoraceae bacterium]|nr:hypothetical protein [Halobacteriovoraceae bacterium]
MKFLDALSGFQLVINIASSLLEKKNIKDKKVLELYSTLKLAILKTRIKIERSGGLYEQDLELYELWDKVFQISYDPVFSNDTRFPVWLETKADFWANPQEFLSNKDGSRTVPTLKSLDAELDRLKEKIEKVR